MATCTATPCGHAPPRLEARLALADSAILQKAMCVHLQRASEVSALVLRLLEGDQGATAAAARQHHERERCHTEPREEHRGPRKRRGEHRMAWSFFFRVHMAHTARAPQLFSPRERELLSPRSPRSPPAQQPAVAQVRPPACPARHASLLLTEWAQWEPSAARPARDAVNGAENDSGGATLRTRRSRPSRSPPPQALPASPRPAAAAEEQADDVSVSTRGSTAEPQSGGERPAEEEYKRVILLLRMELGKAREEVQRLKADQQEVQGSENASANNIILQQEQELFKAKEALARAQADLESADRESKEGREATDQERNSAKVLALDAANIMLRAEKDELNEQVRSLQEKVDRANQELAKEKGAHTRAQQSYKSLETQLNNLENQVQEQVQQQAKAHVVQLEHVRHEWETKFTNAQDKYTAKMAEHDAGILELARVRSQYENKLADKEQARACLRLQIVLECRLFCSF